MIKSKGRMIRCDISTSHKIASLSPEALALFCLLIPHFNSRGKMNGNINFIKGQVCQLIPWLTLEKIESCLKEISEKTNVKWFEHKGLMYLQSLNWSEHQDLREDRFGVDTLPSYQVPENAGNSLGELPLEGRSKKEEIRSARKKKESNSAPMAHPSLDEVKAFFISSNFDPTEAEVFFDHFQSNGWKVSGKSPMKDWQAAARNWHRRAPAFKRNQQNVPVKTKTPNHLDGREIIAKQSAADAQSVTPKT